jgi:hypothetical protein
MTAHLKIGAKPKVRRVRVYTRLSLPVRKRLTEYCAAKGVSERTVIETALSKHLDGTGDTATVLGRLDRLDVALDRERRQRELLQRDVEVLSESFGRFLRLWFAAHAQADAGHAGAARKAADAQYEQFARAIAEHFRSGHRFVHDLPNVDDEPGI